MKSLKDFKIGIICGGWSTERDISLKSGEAVFKCFSENGYKPKLIDLVSKDMATVEKTYEDIDLAFILVHGRGGEDGYLQNYLCLLYTSPSPRDRQKSRMPSSA